jgi:nanoRNase/pAp phosphatase (c-di-AMP/oligoRNAs hydrolase)
LVDYTEDRDLWRHALPYTEEVNAALRSMPLDFDVWDQLALREPAELVQEGQAIRRLEKQIVEQHVRQAAEVRLVGHQVYMVNATVLFSEIAGRLAQGRAFGVCYFDRSDGKRQWSLRSDEQGVDVSKIARKFGGGGHRNAAGFETDPAASIIGLVG